MKDLSAAIAAAREALDDADLNAYGVKVVYASALSDLLAALDAAQGEAVAWKITLADNTGTYDYAQWAGLQAPQAPPAKRTPIDELVRRYESEGCDFGDMEWVRKASLRYEKTMPDSQVRCLMYALASAPPAAMPVGQ